jgi:hypothetical protein
MQGKRRLRLRITPLRINRHGYASDLDVRPTQAW